MNSYFWCFSHGTMHQSDWCTATNFELRVEDLDAALHLVEYLFGDAKFLHELPGNLQYIVTFYSRLSDEG